MSSDQKVDGVDCSRRRLLVATSAVGGVAGITAAVPFVASMLPSERAKSAGAPVEADISKLAPGQMMTVEWRGKPVWIIHRSPEMLEGLKKIEDKVSDPKSERPNQPDYAKNEMRSIKPEYMVAVGICTHLGCSPTEKFATGSASGIEADWPGGFFCPCHGSTFDLAGRVYKNKPAPDNLVVPPYKFVGDSKIVIGEDSTTKAA
jgi:ubiquinol-cytochrome c reductase iron-sulfur subunit